MDIHKPDMAGDQATSDIKSLEDATKATIPNMALTASVSDNLHRDTLDAEVNDYISKPFNPEHLFAKLKGIARRL